MSKIRLLILLLINLSLFSCVNNQKENLRKLSVAYIGNEYDVTIQNGAIIKVRPLTNIAVEETVQLSINTRTGFDALIFATLGDRPDGEVKQVIDCIS